uniref:Cytochrome P450, family 7, subfamily B, polypeptide 1 n=1 Tax=Cyclopterus lumpus TaxID=8103 RepID=A0A8C2ZSR6_CYCLU
RWRNELLAPRGIRNAVWNDVSCVRRDGEPPLIKGWIPFVGKALEFGRDAHKFLEEHKKKFGDVFTVQIAGKYMTFIMDPLLYPSITRHGRQLDFHEFSDKVAPDTFGYPPVLGGKFPGMHEQIHRCYKLLQGDGLSALTESMMGNLMLVFRQDHLGERPEEEGGGWRSVSMYEFCNAIMFEATFLTMFGRPASDSRHADMARLRGDFVQFDTMFPLLIAQIPIWLLGRTKAVRDKLIDYFLPHKLSSWSDTSLFIRTRSELLDQYEALKDVDKAAHHLTILWASVGNTVPATFWALYYLLSHPEDLQVVRQELQFVLRLSRVQFSRDRDVRLDRDQLEQLVYLESAINESLRLSSASINIRVAQEDFGLRLDGERSVHYRVLQTLQSSYRATTEYYRVLQATEYYRALQSHYRVLQSSYRVLQSTTEQYIAVQSTTENYRVIQSSTEYYRALHSSTEHYRVLQSSTEY